MLADFNRRTRSLRTRCRSRSETVHHDDRRFFESGRHADRTGLGWTRLTARKNETRLSDGRGDAALLVARRVRFAGPKPA